MDEELNSRKIQHVPCFISGRALEVGIPLRVRDPRTFSRNSRVSITAVIVRPNGSEMIEAGNRTKLQISTVLEL